MVTPHLPPEQAAVALLPVTIGDALSALGVITSYVSHPSGGSGAAGVRDVVYLTRRGRNPVSRSKVGAFFAGLRMIAGARSSIARSDLVHLHSNGLLIEVAAWLAQRQGKPYVMTLYGTDVSAHDPARHTRFARVIREASARVFYSRGLLQQASAVGLAPEPATVIYAPVSPDFHETSDRTRTSLRHELGVDGRTVLLTVKHLRPVGGHDTLLNAMPAIVRARPDVLLWLAGDGDLRRALEAACRDRGIAPHVRFLGRLGNDVLSKYYAAADLFVLPSHVESWGTVMLESMACGTPVVATDTVGGLEVHQHFPDDVALVPRVDAARLADAVLRALAPPRRVSPAAMARIGRDFTVAACSAQYLEVYQQALGRRQRRAPG
jgi:glycosyltransferase involved in cell wall biosynthesis